MKNTEAMERIIPAVDPDLVAGELTPERFVRDFRELEIYVVTARDSPKVMDEIGRIREIEFREEGGGTGKAKDIDHFDTEGGFRQLVAWDPAERELVAMYRYITGCSIRPDGDAVLPTARLFDLSETFLSAYLPYTIELGRSVVNRSSKKKMHGLYAVWSGLGALIAEMPDMKYFFGKVTTYDRLDARARRALMHFLDRYFGDSEQLLRPKPDVAIPHEAADSDIAEVITGENYKTDYRCLVEFFASLGQILPPLFISYIGLSSTLKVFGTAKNPHFGDVYETAMMVTIEDIYQKHRDRFVGNYTSVNPGIIR